MVGVATWLHQSAHLYLFLSLFLHRSALPEICLLYQSFQRIRFLVLLMLAYAHFLFHYSLSSSLIFLSFYIIWVYFAVSLLPNLSWTINSKL